MRIATLKRVVVGAATGCALLATPAWAAQLKITSFPDGALVTIDGQSTGKVTPAQLAVTEGTHQVSVAIDGSGWDPVTTSVLVGAGNNDLSVTLLPHVVAGAPGQSVTSETLPAGNANCPYGGSRFTSASGENFACHGMPGAPGATGAQGIPGEPGPQGPPGPSLPDCPSAINEGPTCATAESVGQIAWAGSALYGSTLPAGASGDHWYAMNWGAAGSPPNAVYHPRVRLRSGLTQYVFDVYYDCAGTRVCSLPGQTSFGSQYWELIAQGDPSDLCVSPGTPVYVRVRPIGMNLNCEPYTIAFENN